MPNNGYFDFHRDMVIERDDGFFCEGCLIGHPGIQQSPDPRYCRGCYEFLCKEAEIVTNRPKWVPKPLKVQVSELGTLPDPVNHTLTRPIFDYRASGGNS